uniref:Cytochrome c oxidase subunit 3 n=1 Tax=Polycarpa mytiligera TaxID=569436 RepID=S0DFD4_POLMY|nr:cytochrome c oxidase subunit III [Polycarpa mytiligera]CCO25741.1 cytochrome c oxidase subunit III [Polycarpa mytiligera]
MYRSNPFHLVDQSPWPIMASLCALQTALGLVVFMHMKSSILLFLSLFFLLVVSYLWWRDVSRESSYLGFHMIMVQRGLRIGMILFILSEVFFFLGFFWTFFHSGLAAVSEIGGVWPPYGIETLDPLNVPLLNTVVLLSSGITVTYSHHSMISGLYSDSVLGLILTLVLGFLFTFLQGMEYFESSFNISDSVYGSIFFMATGFHGFHVIVGSLFLLANLLRLLAGQLVSFQHIGYECAIWYWHFVDVVWIFLYSSVYWWGSV